MELAETKSNLAKTKSDLQEALDNTNAKDVLLQRANEEINRLQETNEPNEPFLLCPFKIDMTNNIQFRNMRDYSSNLQNEFPDYGYIQTLQSDWQTNPIGSDGQFTMNRFNVRDYSVKVKNTNKTTKRAAWTSNFQGSAKALHQLAQEYNPQNLQLFIEGANVRDEFVNEKF